MNIKPKMKDFRNVNRTGYPELNGYSDKEIYHDFIGCGGLYLATRMIRKMNLKKGDIVLDLGCGFGSSSVFLTQLFDITVVSVDCWFHPTDWLQKVNDAGLSGRIIPLNLDVTETMPFADGYFDAIFCLNSLFLFGENADFLRKLIGALKTGGAFCVGSECFHREPGFQKGMIPEVYDFQWDWNIWDACYAKYHCPDWWKSRLSETGLLDIEYCEELDDGRILFEDFALNYDHYLSDRILSLNAVVPQEKIVDQILYGREHELYPTLFVMRGKKVRPI